jgi:hypothetical protein
VALLLPAFLIGWVAGFLLLEDRDDGPLLAIDVSPIGKVGFLAYRLVVTVGLTLSITFLAVQLLVPTLDWWLKLLVLIMVPVDSALSAAILPALARNKVEGLALTKLTNIAALVPLVAIAPAPWRFVAGIIPTYWLGELILPASTNSVPTGLVVVATVATHALVAVVIFRRLASRAG